MTTVWKVLGGLALVVPLGAYVVGSLAASAADDPPPRETIVIQESATPDPTVDPTVASTPTPTPRTPGPDTRSTRPDEVEVITPDYDDFDDRDDHGLSLIHI